MKTHFLTKCALASLLALSLPVVHADEEQDLIGILQSNGGIPTKAEACKRLRLIGTARSVPALAALLGEERLSQAARYALEGMPDPEAVAALRQAVGTTSGRTRTGVIDSLGWRRDSAAVSLLVPLVSDPDPATAATAAAALGRIGGPGALAALEVARDKAPTAVRPAVLDALLSSAERLLAEGRRAEALTLYQSLAVPAETEAVRVAAHVGWIRTAGDGALALILSGMKSADPAAQTAALQCAGELADPAAMRGFARMLPDAAPGLQIALLALLREPRGEAVLPPILTAAGSPDATVRLAALQALGMAGDATVVPLLADAASSTNVIEQAAAREALTTLHRGDVTLALAAHVHGAPPAVQRELFRALSARADPAAVPPLLALARGDQAATRAGALQALGQVADGSHLAALVGLLAEARDPSSREDVRGVFETLVERYGDAAGLDVAPIVKGLEGGDAATRQALFPVAALFVDERVRATFRTALQEGDAGIREAATRAVCTTRDVALLPDLLEVARRVSDPKLRALALESAARLATDEGASLTPAQRADALANALALAQRPEEKRAVLASLGSVPHLSALALADRAANEPSTRADAESASLQIARRLGASDFAGIEPSLTRLATGAVADSVRTNAQALLKTLDSGWLCVGPYRQEGKRGDELFDVPFAPEQAGAKAKALAWRRASGTTDLTRVGEVDLASLTGGDHCVVYVKTRVHVPEARSVSFAIGSDDGIKLWVNGELVHANNAVRGLTPGQDRARGRLRSGWNDLLAKITQSTAGCGLMLRVLTDNGDNGDNGDEVPGLRWEATGGSPR